MADDNNSSNKAPAEDSSKNDGQPADNGADESKNTGIDPAEQARRDQQSKKDKANADKSDAEERLSALEARESERLRDQHVQDFLSENSDKFPDVKADNPMFKYALSEEDVKSIATDLQDQYKDMQQRALSDVQLESEKLLSDEEIAEKEKELEEEVTKTGRSGFSSFLETAVRRKK